MKATMEYGIAQSLSEGLTAYLNDGFVSNDGEYFVQKDDNGRYPTDDAISYLSNWIECSYNNEDDEDKGTIEEWKDICITKFIDYFELELGNSDDKSMYQMIYENISFL